MINFIHKADVDRVSVAERLVRGWRNVNRDKLRLQALEATIKSVYIWK